MNAANSRGRLDAELAHEAATCTPRRCAPRRRGAAPNVADRVGERARARAAAASRRAASPCASRRAARRSTFARVRASQTNAASYGLCVDDRDRPVLAREPPDAQRQQRVEERPVEERQPPHEAEGAVVLRAPVRGGREHAQLEAVARARELPLEARRERQLVPRARDEEQPRLHASTDVDDGAHAVGELLGRREPARRRFARALAEALGELAVGERRARARRRAPAVSPGSTSRPFDAVARRCRGIPPTRVATTARPRQERLDHDARQALGRRRQEQRARGVERAARPRPARAGGPSCAPSRASAAATSACVPSPTRWSRASGTRRGDEPPRGREARRRSCSARARRRRAAAGSLRQRARRARRTRRGRSRSVKTPAGSRPSAADERRR